MSRVAEETSIGRATLYKHFPDVESILLTWHKLHVGCDLERLTEIRNRPGDPSKQLEVVLEAYAFIEHKGHASEPSTPLHRGEHADRARRHLADIIRDLLREAADTGHVRDDIASDELASYCLSALAAASGLPNEAAVRRLVRVTLDGLRLPC